VQQLLLQGAPLNVVNNCGGGTALLYAIMHQMPKVRGKGVYKRHVTQRSSFCVCVCNCLQALTWFM
jgi:hypothetical protein